MSDSRLAQLDPGELQALLEFGKHLSQGRQPEGRADRVKAPALRSVLYVPATRRDWIRKCPRYGADAIVLDLEDSVPTSEKAAARAIVADEIEPLSRQVRSVWVRVNADSLGEDLAAAVRPGLSVVQIPKVVSCEAVEDLDRELGWHEGRGGMPYGSIVISPILETAGGLLHAHEVASCSRRVEYLGAVVAPEGDTALALGMEVMSDLVGTESLFVRSKVALDARAAGVRHVIGGTVTDLRPPHDLFRSFSSMNRAVGYTGSLVIHPEQVPIANAIFGPTAAQIELAIETLRLLRAAGGAAAVRNERTGQMVDLAHARHAYEVLVSIQTSGIQP